MNATPLAAVEDGAADALRLALLDETDLDRIETLHHLSMGPVPRPDIVKPEKRSFFAGILGGRGTVWGLFDGDELVAYAILQHEILADDDPRALLGLGGGARVAKLAGAAVAPEWRGRGLQRRLIALRAQAAADVDVLFSTAAPLNIPSWTNLIAEGFAVRAIVARYGGLVRYLLAREPDTPRQAHATRQALAPLDLDGQRALLADGWRGVCTSTLDGMPAIVYTPGGR